jgi:two-component system NtrC family sensor kinase
MPSKPAHAEIVRESHGTAVPAPDMPLDELLAADGRLDAGLLRQLAFNEKMAELGRLAAGLVHELNTPLSVIVSAAQMIQREEELPDFVREMVERIGSEAQRLSQFAKGVLSFSRREEGPESEADVNQIIREVLAFLRYEAQKRSITVIDELDFDLAAVAADANLLKQVFINLIMNALQAIGSKGVVLLRTRMQNETFVCVEISDTGPGIAPELQERIFEPFYSSKGPEEGTGLGLYVTRQLMWLSGGEIGVSSVPGEGATFILQIPARLS